MDSVYSSANIFSDVKQIQFPRHKFDLSYTNSYTMNHAELVPNLVDLVKPGDLLNVRTYGRVQLTPLATSSMQNIRYYQRYFYIPFRLLWNKWDDFIRQDGFVETPMLAPYTTINGGVLNSLMTSSNSNKLLDFMGVGFDNRDSLGEPIMYSDRSQISFTIFPWLAYHLVWDTYFRDENLQNPTFNIDDVASGYNHYDSDFYNTFLPIAKEKDYFTTALPWTQKGNPVTLGTTINLPEVPVTWNFLDSSNRFQQVQWSPSVYTPSAINPGAIGRARISASSEFTYDTNSGQQDISGVSTFVDGGHLIEPTALFPANTSKSLTATVTPQQTTASVFNINELRYANALQRYLERLALGGNRASEFYLSMYGVQVDDLRIGQPKYLGGGSSYVHVSSIPQTSESSLTPQATLAGNGVASVDISFNEPYYAQEFGILLGVCYIRPELNYTQGLPRTLQLFSHLDYYNPLFAHLGEEEVKTSELFLKRDIVINPSTPENENDDVFGYQSRYAYLKGKRNEIHGELKTTLRDWMISSRFVDTPVLNSTFIKQPKNFDIFAVTDSEDHYIVEMRHEYEMVSNMPDFAIPSL